MIQPQHENLLVSSMLLWLDNTLISRGGYTNTSSRFYPMGGIINNYTVFGAPYSQFTSDVGTNSITITGVYLNGTFLTKNQSGFCDINYNRGQVLFTGSLPSNPVISGSYGLKQVNTSLTNFPDISVIFEGKVGLRNKTNITNFTGLAQNEITYPVIFLKNVGGITDGYTFGGIDKTVSNIECYLLLSSQYESDAVCGILKDRKNDLVPLFNSGDFPYNNLGGFKNNINFNYTGIGQALIESGQYAYIDDVIITDFSRRFYSEIQSITPDCYFSIVEFKVCKPRIT